MLFVGHDHAHATAKTVGAGLHREAGRLNVARAQSVGRVGDDLLAALVHLCGSAFFLLLLPVLVKNVTFEHDSLLMNTVALSSEDISDLVAVVFSMS